MQTNTLKTLVVAAALPLLYLADVSPDAPLGLTLGREAHAVVGAPARPMSAAGVARRTTRRVVAAETSAATSQQQAATAQKQQTTSQQQAAPAQPQQGAAARPAGAPAVGSVITALPAGCKPETKSGIEYQNCGGVYYRSAFQGNNLVYVAQ